MFSPQRKMRISKKPESWENHPSKSFRAKRSEDPESSGIPI
jgi:hypothetical protein